MYMISKVKVIFNVKLNRAPLLRCHNHLRFASRGTGKESRTNSISLRQHYQYSSQVPLVAVKSTFSEKENILLKKIQALNKDVPEMEIMTTLDFLQQFDWCPLHVIEVPHIVALRPDNILSKMEYLDNLGLMVSPATINLVKNMRNELRSDIVKYQSERNGHSSNLSFYEDIFECSEEELFNLAISNPRLLQRQKNLQRIKNKIGLLLSLGYTITDIKNASHVLLNISEGQISNRFRQAKQNGLSHMPLNVMGQNNGKFQKYVGLQGSNLKKSDLLCETLKLDKNEVIYGSDLLNLRTSKIKPKLDLLLELDYHVDDILENSSYLGKISCERIKKCHNQLLDMGFEEADLNLHKLIHFSSQGSVRSSKKTMTRQRLASYLQCEVKEIPALGQSSKALVLQKRRVISKNYDFLLKKGFSIQAIASLPVILAHDHEILKHHWSEAIKSDKFAEWQHQPTKLLNLLQYYIEKESNFAQLISLQSETLNENEF